MEYYVFTRSRLGDADVFLPSCRGYFFRTGSPPDFDVIIYVLFQCENGDICASLQVYPIEIKYLGFSRVSKGRDVKE